MEIKKKNLDKMFYFVCAYCVVAMVSIVASICGSRW